MSLEAEFATFEQLTDELFAMHRARIDSLLTQVGLTATQAFALFNIAQAGETKMSPLADSLGLSPGAATSLVERLVEQGLVERRRISDDRRAVCVHLTEQGQALLDRTIQLKREMGQRLFELLPGEARAQLLGALSALKVAQLKLDERDGLAS